MPIYQTVKWNALYKIIAQGLEKGVEKKPKALCLQKNDGES